MPAATLVNARQYRWNITACPDFACSSGYVTSGNLTFTTPAATTGTLVAPTALAPAGTIATLTPVFSWSGGSGAANYEINVRDLTTNVIVLRQQGISTSSTSFTMPAATLVNARQYRWNITACPDFACSSGYVTSGDLTFTTPATTTGPLITSFAVSPVTLSVGIPVVFTFTGTDLPPGLVLSFPGCSAVIVNGWTTTLQQYACTLMQSGVNFQGTITTFSGNVLYTFHQSVVPTVIGVGPGGLFVGYYAEDPITNPEDPGVGALYLRFPASPGPFAGAMYFTVAGCQTNNVGAISGTKTDAGIAGSWSGTVDGVIQSGAYSGIYSSTLGAYSGDYTVSGGKQFITVANCLQYWVAPKGTWEVTAIGDGVPTAFRLTTIGTTVMWTPRVGAVITHVSVIDEADALAGGANAIKYQAYSVQGAPTFNLASIPGLVAGRSYVVAVTTTTSNNQRTGVASARIVLATSVSTFFDDFSRPDGPVGNGWQTGTGRTAGDLVLVGGKLTTPVTAGDWLMYRPFDISGGVSVSFTITETAGSTLTGGRYESAVWMGSTGAYLTGYGLYIVHSGNGVDNSGVYLYLNGTPACFYSIAISVRTIHRCERFICYGWNRKRHHPREWTDIQL